uniref:Hexosyltransferase n=1 Tax=Cyprinus carpio TaxID=7962 RepID=A0A8C1RA65_CYPCA
GIGLSLMYKSLRYHDIIQQDYRDTYNNLTLKTLIGMYWITKYCPEAKYILKTDSDMFVNTEYLIEELLNPRGQPKQRYLTGHLMPDMSQNRNKEKEVYVGKCLAKLKIKPKPPPNELLFNHWRVPYSSCRYSNLISSHGFHPNEIIQYWQHLQSNKHNPCQTTG